MKTKLLLILMIASSMGRKILIE